MLTHGWSHLTRLLSKYRTVPSCLKNSLLLPLCRHALPPTLTPGNHSLWSVPIVLLSLKYQISKSCNMSPLETGFFHLAKCLENSPILLYLYFFLSNIHFMDIPELVYPFTHWNTFGWVGRFKYYCCKYLCTGFCVNISFLFSHGTN